MMINYWDCKYKDYDEGFDSVDQIYTHVYGCLHPKNPGNCPLENKWGDDLDNCWFLDMEE